MASGLEACFRVQITEDLTPEEEKNLVWFLSETFDPEGFGTKSFLRAQKEATVEIGPQLNFATAANTNAVAMCHACGLTKVNRIEQSRILLAKSTGKLRYPDDMTEQYYDSNNFSFDINKKREAVYQIPLMEEGPDVLKKIPGISMDEADRMLYYNYFVKECGRNPTNVEIMDLNNANSEHCRHAYFKGKMNIDGQTMNETLMEIVKSTLKANPNNSLVAFKDNSSVIKGYLVKTIIPEFPGRVSRFKEVKVTYHFLLTVETHNFPTGVAPFPGAETGTGGRIRDVQATGRGGLVVAGGIVYCVGNLFIPGYDLPWENKSLTYPTNLASPLKILIDASNGASDYGNKFGEPVIIGATRSVCLFQGNERREFLKPVLATAGIGQIDTRHTEKNEAEKDMLIIEIGGPGYRIGVGGGAASSKLQGENEAKLDFNAVQRGDAEMEQKMNRVIRACIEMGENNPLDLIHDSGAGGSANVLKESVGKAGGLVNIRKIKLGDSTMSVLEIWIAEYQERNGLLLRSERLEEFQEICEREQVNCELLGYVTGDGHFVVYDEEDDSTPVNLDLEKVLGNIPQKTFNDETIEPELSRLDLPSEENFAEALERVLKLLSVGSKRFLINKVDRSVTGLIAAQQGCGPLHLPVGDYGIIAQSHFPNESGIYTGAAIAMGEQPVKMLVDIEAGAHLSVIEALTNIAFANISCLEDIKFSGNWMWAAKLKGEGSKLYRAAVAIRDLMVKLGVAIDGGKDSLTMGANVPCSDGSVEIVKSPSQFLATGYCSVPDITKKVTPDIKHPGKSCLMRIDLGNRKRRLGGSALAQVYKQIGNDCPDVEQPELVVAAFKAINELIDKKLVLAAHDISDGGFVCTALEMAFAGNCGLVLNIDCDDEDIMKELFAEEAGWIIEYDSNNQNLVNDILKDIPQHCLIFAGETMPEKNIIIFDEEGEFYFKEEMVKLRQIWEETSFQLEKLQSNPVTAEAEKENIYNRPGPNYTLSFSPQPTLDIFLNRSNKPKVAIIREEGSNGDREMTSAFHHAGFECYDILMDDLLKGKISLEIFRGIAFVGGFSYADILGAAKGWAGKILFHPTLKKMFDDFYNRSDTFSLGVCNGCQLMALLGWVPWKGTETKQQPRFIKNISGRFESRFSTVKILPSPAIMLEGMEESTLGIWVAHGEGNLHVPDNDMLGNIIDQSLAPLRYVNDDNQITNDYPFNPNGSPLGIAALCDPTGRHLAMMPHPERCFIKWQSPWLPESWENLHAAPWLKMFQNAREWCDKESK